MKNGDFTSIGAVLKKFNKEKDKYISREFQKYGYELARSLGELKNRGLYIGLAKKEPRAILERIKYEVLDSNQGESLGKLFMWKLGQYHWRKKLEESILPFDFFDVSPVEGAKRLLGRSLVSIDEYGILRAGKIVETEAYSGEKDLASHARFGLEGKGGIMFGPPARSYVYLIYGQHSMFNVVVHRAGGAGAVLIRSLKPLVGGKGKLATGPGKLTNWLKILRSDNGRDLTKGEKIWLAKGEKINKENINCGKRVGIDYAEEWAEKKWRFWIKYTRYKSD